MSMKMCSEKKEVRAASRHVTFLNSLHIAHIFGYDLYVHVCHSIFNQVFYYRPIVLVCFIDLTDLTTTIA